MRADLLVMVILILLVVKTIHILNKSTISIMYEMMRLKMGREVGKSSFKYLRDALVHSYVRWQ